MIRRVASAGETQPTPKTSRRVPLIDVRARLYPAPVSIWHYELHRDGVDGLPRQLVAAAVFAPTHGGDDTAANSIVARPLQLCVRYGQRESKSGVIAGRGQPLLAQSRRRRRGPASYVRLGLLLLPRQPRAVRGGDRDRAPPLSLSILNSCP